MPIVGGIARGQGQSAAGGPLSCRPWQSPRGRAGSTGLATSSSAPSPSSGSLPTAAPSLPPRPRAVGGRVPPALASPWPTAAAPAAGRRETWPCDPGKRTCVPTAGAALPRLDTACVTAARLPSATFWEGKSVGTLGPAPGDGRPVYAHVYLTGSDVAAQNLERVVTLRHGSELFNLQSGSRSRAGRPGDWVGGGTGQSSAATVCGDVTDSNLPPKQPRRRLPSLPLSAPGRGRWPQRPPAFPFRDADPAGGGGRWGVCAGCLRFGSRAGETFPHPPRPGPRRQHLTLRSRTP